MRLSGLSASPEGGITGEAPSGAVSGDLPPRSPGAALRPWILLLAGAGLGVPAILWVFQNEAIHSSIQVGNSVPPIPALAALLLLAAVAGLAGRRRLQGLLDHAGILQVYLLVTVAAAIPSVACLNFVFAYVALPHYLAQKQSGMAQLASNLPGWFAPADPEAVRQFFEGSPEGVVPWRVWLGPLAAWGFFLFVLLLTLYALLVLLRRPWSEQERLTYPMVQIPLRLLGDESRGQPPIWRDPLMWTGFGLVALFDGTNMLHAFYPSFPSLGSGFEIGSLFPDRPWSALAPMRVSYRPEIFGIAYLMPAEVLLTTAAGYLLLRASTVLRVAYGEQVASTAYDYQELGIGAFLSLFALLVRRAGPELRRSLLQALGRRPAPAGQDEPLSPRAAWAILLFGTAAMVAWLWLAGLPVWLGSAHLLLLIAVAVVYARMRAETGSPMLFLFPFWQQQHLLLNLLGPQGLSGGSDRVLTVFAAMGSLSRGYYPELCAYGAEGMKLASHARFPQRQVTTAVVAGILLGLLLGGYLYLTAAYRIGANLLDGGGTGGGYRIFLAAQQYTTTRGMFGHPTPPKLDLAFQSALGGAVVLGLNWARQRFFWFPFHPMGFAMASAYGFHLWAPFLAVWVLKVLILRLGGHATYRRLVPLFLGFALGRYLFAGLVWGGLGLFGHPATTTYPIHFG